MNRFKECLLNAEVNQENPTITIERLKRIDNFGKDRGFITPEHKSKIGTFHAQQFIKEYSPISEVRGWKREGDIFEAEHLNDSEKLGLLKAFFRGQL